MDTQQKMYKLWKTKGMELLKGHVVSQGKSLSEGFSRMGIFSL